MPQVWIEIDQLKDQREEQEDIQDVLQKDPNDLSQTGHFTQIPKGV
ncbi:hypothetical protein HMPREF9950_0590 [Streptococcus oralis SK313]|uniref:Uncharacterized protein n=1 Tax=Streptococcus oralis SK313 TaxID=1035190 RepID=F9Q4P7_STROR|nr:hypothetical protein HMPREF9950_0590 [Streptococcus oralis SK313]